MKVQCWWEAGLRLIGVSDMEMWTLRHPLRDATCCQALKEQTGS